MSGFALIACNMSDFAFIATVMFRAQSYWKREIHCYVSSEVMPEKSNCTSPEIVPEESKV